MKFVKKLKSIAKNIPGPRVKEKIVVIESDDWGTIRTPSVHAFESLCKEGILDPKNGFSRYDTLESNDDLIRLFDVLTKHKDSRGNHPIITADTIVANPDFEKIQSSSFQEYHYESFPETLNKYPNRDKVLSLYKEGIQGGFFIPQFHGREHVNVRQWMSLLQANDQKYHSAFKWQTFSIDHKSEGTKRNNLMAAFDFENEEEKASGLKIVASGIELFKEIFDYSPKSFIAPCYIWDSSLEERLHQNQIESVQGIKYQYVPKPGATWYNTKNHYTGEMSEQGLCYLVRNAPFEPSPVPSINYLEECLMNVSMAFKMSKPAIITSHRVNFLGALDPKNSDKNLKTFDELLRRIIKNWPEVIFMSSDQLSDHLRKK